MRKKIIVVISGLLVLLSIVACGMPNDPMIDDVYSRDIFPGMDSTYDVGSATLTFAEGHFDNLYIGGSSISTSSYGELYITAALATTCTLADTYYLVSGTTTADELRGFTHNGSGRLTYTGTDTRVCLVAAAISVSSDTNNVVLSTKVYVNGAAHEASLIQRKIATAGDIGAQALITLLTLTTSDYVEIYIAVNKAGTEITFNCMSLTATTVD